MSGQETRQMTRKDMAVFFGVPYMDIVDAALRIPNPAHRRQNQTFDAEAVREILLTDVRRQLKNAREKVERLSETERRIESAGK